MKSCSLLPLALLTSSLVMAETEEHLNQRFPARPGAKLAVEIAWGSIEVLTNGTGETTVEVTRKVSRSRKEDEEAFLREHPVSITQEGDTVRVICRADSKPDWFGPGRNRQVAKYTISVPAPCDAKLKTSGASISVSDLTGDVQARTSGGGLKLAGLHGPLRGATSGGSIQLDDCHGDLQVKTSGGDIRATGGSGTLAGATSGGKIEVGNFHGPVQVGTSGGGINLDNVAGRLRASTSGGSIAARFSSPLTEPVDLKTSGGGLTLLVPEQSAFNLDASTSGGTVKCDLPVETQDKRGKDHLQGPINGGGSLVVLRTSGGNIQVKKR